MFGSRSCHVFNVKKTFKCCFPCDRSCSCRIKDIFASVCVIWAVFDFNPLSGAQCCCLLELERMEELEDSPFKMMRLGVHQSLTDDI